MLIFPSYLFATPKKIINFAITSDLHGWLSTQLIYPDRRKASGLLHIKPIIKQLRELDPNLVLLDAGDTLSGSPFTHFLHHKNRLKQDLFFQELKKLNYTAITIGNHDLEINPLLEKYYLPNSNFTWLAGNLNPSKWIRPYLSIQRKGVKIVILGMTTIGVKMWIHPKKYTHLKIQDPLDAIPYWLKKIEKQEKPDILIGLFHIGRRLKRDSFASRVNLQPLSNTIKRIAQQYPQFSFIISGHDHLISRKNQLRYIAGVPIIEAGSWGRHVIHLQAELKQIKTKWHLSKVKHHRYNAISYHPSSKDYKKKLPISYLNYIDKKTLWKYEGRSRKKLEYCINTLLSQATKNKFTDITLHPYIKIFRNSIKTNDVISRKHIFRWLPYQNRTIQIQLNQREIQILISRKKRKQKFLFSYFYNQALKNKITKKSKSFFLDKLQWEKKYFTLISDYHFHGGKGLLAPLFLKKKKIVKVAYEVYQKQLFNYLLKNKTLPNQCNMLTRQFTSD